MARAAGAAARDRGARRASAPDAGSVATPTSIHRCSIGVAAALTRPGYRWAIAPDATRPYRARMPSERADRRALPVPSGGRVPSSMVLASERPAPNGAVPERRRRTPGGGPRAGDRPIRRGPTRSAGSRPRSAAARTSTACSTTSSTRRSRCSASTRPACGCTTDAPTPARARRPARPVAGDPRGRQTRCPRDAHDGGMDALRDAARPGPGAATCGARRPGCATIYRASRGPDDLLRPDRLPRRAARPARALPPRGYAWTADETDLARAFADHMATAIGNARLADSRRGRWPPACGRSPTSPAASTGSRTSTASPRRSSPEAKRAHRPRHDPRLPRRPRDRHVRADRLPGDVPGHDRPRRRRTLRVADRRGPDRLGRRSTARPSASATPRADPRGARSSRRRTRPGVDAARPDESTRTSSTASSSCRSTGATGSTPTTRRP